MSTPTRKQTPRNRYTTDSLTFPSEEASPITIDDSTARVTMPETDFSEQSTSSSQQNSEYQSVPSNSQQLLSTPTTPIITRNQTISHKSLENGAYFPLNTNKSPMRWFLKQK